MTEIRPEDFIPPDSRNHREWRRPNSYSPVNVTPDEYTAFLHVLKAIPQIVKRHNDCVARSHAGSHQWLDASDFVHIGYTSEVEIGLFDFPGDGSSDHARLAPGLLWLDDAGWEAYEQDLAKLVEADRKASEDHRVAEERRQLARLLEKHPDMATPT